MFWDEVWCFILLSLLFVMSNLLARLILSSIIESGDCFNVVSGVLRPWRRRLQVVLLDTTVQILFAKLMLIFISMFLVEWAKKQILLRIRWFIIDDIHDNNKIITEPYHESTDSKQYLFFRSWTHTMWCTYIKKERELGRCIDTLAYMYSFLVTCNPVHPSRWSGHRGLNWQLHQAYLERMAIVGHLQGKTETCQWTEVLMSSQSPSSCICTCVCIHVCMCGHIEIFRLLFRHAVDAMISQHLSSRRKLASPTIFDYVGLFFFSN